MLPPKLAEIVDLIPQALALDSSGHPYLDKCWSERPHFRRTYYRFCMLLARALQPDLVVELGTDEGGCCGHWSFGHPEASVIGVDHYLHDTHRIPICAEMSKNFPRFRNIQKWTWDALSDVRAVGAAIDILFIDSWHTYHYFARDWNDYSPLLASPSVVLMDDLHMGDVKEGFNRLSGEKYVDASMNPAIPMGILIPDAPVVLPCEPQLHMPEYKGDA